MPSKPAIWTAYELPFEVHCSPENPFSPGGAPIRGTGRCKDGKTPDPKAVADVLAVFARLSGTGALAGTAIPPGRSGAELIAPAVSGPELTFGMKNAALDARAVVVLAHLFMARRKDIPLTVLELTQAGGGPSRLLHSEPGESSTYPDRFASLPFALENEEPDSGAYTFTAMLLEPLREDSSAILSGSLASWVRAVRAGAYGLAPIPPESSYAEPSQDEVISFATTAEWTVNKVKADDPCIDGLINLFCAFHERVQKLARLEIT